MIKIEEKIFMRKRFVPERMLEFGFTKEGGKYIFLNWISVVLNDLLSDDEIIKLIEESFKLTKK